MSFQSSSYTPDRLHNECLQICPPMIAGYIAHNMSTFTKVTNHVLCLTLLCECFLWISSWSVTLVPIRVVTLSMVLILHSIFVLQVLNPNMGGCCRLAPTSYWIGICTGTSVGAALLSMMISNVYKRLVECGTITAPPPIPPMDLGNSTAPPPPLPNSTSQYTDPVFSYICEHYMVEHAGSMRAVAFWGGFLFWLHTVTALLLYVGRDELSTRSNPYQHVGAPQPPSAESSRPNFVGDYATIPEIRNVPTASSSSLQQALHHQQQQAPQVQSV